MSHVQLVVNYRSDLPAGLPAIWDKARRGGDWLVTLFLRADLPTCLGYHFKCMAIRDVMPGVDFDAFTISDLPAAASVLQMAN